MYTDSIGSVFLAVIGICLMFLALDPLIDLVGLSLG